MNIFKKPEPRAVEVEGVTVFIRPLTAGGLAKLLADFEATKANGEPWKTDFGFVATSVTDAEGKPVFASAGDVADASPAVAGQLLKLCLEANGIGSIEEKKA